MGKNSQAKLDKLIAERRLWEHYETNSELMKQLYKEIGREYPVVQNAAERLKTDNERSKPDAARFNSDADAPLLTAAEDAADFQLTSEEVVETPREVKPAPVRNTDTAEMDFGNGENKTRPEWLPEDAVQDLAQLKAGDRLLWLDAGGSYCEGDVLAVDGDKISVRTGNTPNIRVAAKRYVAHVPAEAAGRKGEISKVKTEKDGIIATIRVNSVMEIKDDDFIRPTRNIELPPLPEWTLLAIGKSAKPVLLKKNILEKNRSNHPELGVARSRDALNRAFYQNDSVGQSQPSQRPNYWVSVKLESGKNAIVVLDVAETKTHHEVVGWRVINERGLELLKKQAIREGGQVLALRIDTSEAPSDRIGTNGSTDIIPASSEKSNKKSEKILTAPADDFTTIEARNRFIEGYGKTLNLIADKDFSDFDRDTLVQAARIALDKKLPLFDPARGVKVETFASRVATNAMRDEMRKELTRRKHTAPLEITDETGEVEHEFGADDTTPADSLVERERERAVQDWFKALPQLDRDILTLRNDKMPYAKIASTLHVAELKVKRILAERVKEMNEKFRDYRIRRTRDNRPVVVVDNDILAGLETDKEKIAAVKKALVKIRSSRFTSRRFISTARAQGNMSAPDIPVL